MSTVDAMSGKIDGGGRKKINAALSGLALALLSYLILSTINVNLLSANFVPKVIDADPGIGFSVNPVIRIVPGSPGTGGVVGGSGTALPTGSLQQNELISAISNGSRGSDGRLNISSYGYSDDLTPDRNTIARRGNSNNLLTAGSVALSPDLISKYKPTVGAPVYVNGNMIGYYEDTTGPGSVNTVDIYDPNKVYGGNNFFKTIPSSGWDLTFGTPRAQTRNP